jgi:hypothetical protein
VISLRGCKQEGVAAPRKGWGNAVYDRYEYEYENKKIAEAVAKFVLALGR